MSLIEEALRRMQEPLVNPPPTQERTPTPQPADAKEPAPIHPWAGAPTAPGGRLEASTTTNPLLSTTLAVAMLTIAMVIGGAVWFGRTLTRPRAASSSAPQRSSAQPVPRSAAAPAPPADTAPDAAAPASQPPPVDDAFALTGVVEGVGEPYAMINGVIVAVGERIGTATLLDIADGTVRLRLDTGEERVLRVPR